MSNPESGFQPPVEVPAKPEARELSFEEEVEEEMKKRKGDLLDKAWGMHLTQDAFMRKMMTGEIPHDPEDFALLMDGMEADAVTEFISNPETQSAAFSMMLAEISAKRLSSAFGVMDRFQIPEKDLVTEEMQGLVKIVALNVLTNKDASGAMELVKRFKIGADFLQSAEAQEAAIVCREKLSKLSGGKIPARIAQLEKDFNLPPME